MGKKKATEFRYWQKIIAIVCAAALIAPLYVRFPRSYAAANPPEHQLVVLLVHESLFAQNPDDEQTITGKIYRYAKDIQNTLPETRTLILPVGSADDSGTVYGALEKLYLEGQKKEHELFRLTGVILIGEVPLPVVRTIRNDAISIFPYTDFEEPAFLWNKDTKVFEENSQSRSLQAEIFHGVIRAPQTNDTPETDWLSSYFDKNHDYHTGKITPPEQAIFFADLVEEFNGQHPLMLKMYEAAKSLFSSDVAHYRFNKTLLKDASSLFSDNLDADVDTSVFSTKPSDILKSMTKDSKFPFPDSITKDRIRQFLPHFVKVVSSYFSTVDPLIKGSGKWMVSEETVDTVPALITRMDIISQEYLRQFSDYYDQLLFEYIDQNLEIPVEMIVSAHHDTEDKHNGHKRHESFDFPNYLNGVKPTAISIAEQCSLMRGEPSSEPREVGDVMQLAQMNHLWNRFGKEKITKKGKICPEYGGCCLMNSFQPNKCNPQLAVVPVFDYEGGELNTKRGPATFLDCAYLNEFKMPIPDRKWYPNHYFYKGHAEYVSFSVKKIPSTILHNEPRPETITKALKNSLSSGIPADETHRVAYQGPGGDYITIALPDFVVPDKIGGPDATHENAHYEMQQALERVENEIRVKTLKSNFASYLGYINSLPYEYNLAPTAENINPLPGKGHPNTVQRPGNLYRYWRVEPKDGYPDLFNELNDIWLKATELLKIEFPGITDENALWVAYLDSGSSALREKIELFIEAEYRGGVLPTPYPLPSVTPTPTPTATEPATSSPTPTPILDRTPFPDPLKPLVPITRFQEFVNNGGATLKTFNRTLSDRDSVYKAYPQWYPEDLDFPYIADPEKGFLTTTLDAAVAQFGAEPLQEFYYWSDLTADQKHLRVIELFFGNNPPTYVDGRPNGYELGSFRARGNSNEIWWGGDQRSYLPGDDAEWDNAISRKILPNASPTASPSSSLTPVPSTGEKATVTPTPAASPPATEEEEACPGEKSAQGVPITEWMPAIQCWMDDTLSKPVSVEMSAQCSYTGILGGEEYDLYDEAWNAGPPNIPAGSVIKITGSDGAYLLPGQSATVSVRFEKPDGTLISGGIEFSVEPIGYLKLIDLPIISDGTGYRDTTFSGEAMLSVEATGTGAAGIRVSAPGFSDAKIMFTYIGNGKLNIERVTDNSGDPLLHAFRVSVRNGAGVFLTGYEGRASAEVSDPAAAFLINQDIPIKNGIGEVAVKVKGSDPVTLTVAMPGFASGSIGIESGRMLPPVSERKLLINNAPEAIGPGEKTVIEVIATDKKGQAIDVVSEVTLKATAKTKNLVTITPLGGNKFSVTGADRVGTVRLVAEAVDYTSARISIPVVFKISKDQIYSLQPNALIVSLLGADFSNFAKNSDPIANSLLFTAKPQAVLSSLNPNTVGQQKLSVFREGGIRFFDRGLEANISSVAPLTIRVFDRLYSESVAEYALSFSGKDAVAADYEARQGNWQDGVFFRNFDTSGELTAKTVKDVLMLSYEGKEILKVDTNISFTILDKQFSLRFEPGTDVPVITLLKNNSTVAGEFLVVGANILILKALQGSAEFFSVPNNADGSQGFSIIGDEDTPALPTGGKAYEMADKIAAPGFNLDDNFALQLASGVPVGDAAKFGFGPNGILLGDPTVAFKLPAADRLFAGFDRGIGKEIARLADNKIMSLHTLDFNNDDLPDILLEMSDQSGRLLKNLGYAGFRDIGEIVTDTSGFHKPIGLDLQGDGFDDILALNDKQKLRLFQNKSEILKRDRSYPLPNKNFIQLDTADFDRDGHPDLLTGNVDGETGIYWGSADGFSETAYTRLGNFGAQVEGGNIALDNTLVSIPNITERTKKIVPLYMSGQMSAADGLTTVDDVLVANGDGDAAEVSDETMISLGQLQGKYPESFSQPISDTRKQDLKSIALFTSPQELKNHQKVSLTITDENGGAALAGDRIRFNLTVKNNTKNNVLHFSLAHVINPALHIDTSSLKVPASWPAGRAAPRLHIPDTGQLRVVDIKLAAGEEQTLSFYAEIEGKIDIKYLIRDNLDLPEYPADGEPDVTVIIPGLNGQYHYLSHGNRQYQQYFEYASEQEIPEMLKDMTDTNRDGVPDKFLTDKDKNNIPDIADATLGANARDTDLDGYPDSWDDTLGYPQAESDGWQGLLDKMGAVSDEIMTYTACDGGCLNIPINYAFLVPGQVNLFEPLVKGLGGLAGEKGGASPGDSAGSTVPGVSVQTSAEFSQFAAGAQSALSSVMGPGTGAGGLMTKVTDKFQEIAGKLKEKLEKVRQALGIPSGPVPGVPILGFIPPTFPCHGSNCYPNSIFRMYVSPTLTGGVGVAFCVGQFTGVANVVPSDPAMCMAFAPKKLNLPICDEPKSKRGTLNSADDGQCSFTSIGSSKSKISKEVGGLRGLVSMLEQSKKNYSIVYDTGKNRRVMPFPWNWLYEQVAEFQAMFSLPYITIYYPELSDLAPDKFRDRFKTLYDDINQKAVNVVDRVEAGGEQISSAVKTMPSTVSHMFVPPTSGPAGAVHDWEAEAKRAAKETAKFKSDLESDLGSFDDLYSAISSLPLINIDPVTLDIKVPYLSRAQILAIMDDLEQWAKEADLEIGRVRENWTSCPPGTPLEQCSANQAAYDHVNVNIQSLINTVKGNLLTLKDYLSLPDAIGKIDATVAQWLSQVMCFLDSAIYNIYHWYVFNKRRLELWIELYFFMKEIINMWEVIKDFFVDFENFCHDCRVDRGALVLSTYQIFMGIIPTPPIIRFPRLPNITIDLSQIKGQVTIPVPRPRLSFVPILFPKIPRLQLPDSPSLEFQLPGIPRIPAMNILPPVPPFPEIPIITLPNIPPAPRIPDIPDFISQFLRIARPFLYVYCLVKNGIFPHPESMLKSVIEDLTMRPSLSMMNFDFSGALFEDFVIPSIREIVIELEINLDLTLGTTLVDAMGAAFAPWNESATDLRFAAAIAQRQLYENLHLFDQSALLDSVKNQTIPIASPLSSLPEKLQQSPQTSALTAFFTELSTKLGDDSAYFQAADLRQKYGARPIVLPDEFPVVAKLNTLRDNIAELRNNVLQERKTLLAYQDVTKIKGNFVADSQLASAVYDTTITGGLPDIGLLAEKYGVNTPDDANVLPSENTTITGRELAELPQPEQALELSNTINATGPNGNVDEVSSGNDTVQPEGMYGQCRTDDGQMSTRVIYQQNFTDMIETTILQDFDGDGDKEMLMATKTGVFLKENHQLEGEPYFYTSPPEIGSLARYASLSPAIKNIRVVSHPDGATVRFDAGFDKNLLGIEISARKKRSGYDMEEQTDMDTILTALLVPTRYLPADKEYTAYVPGDTFSIGPWAYSGNLFIEEFDEEKIKLPLPINSFWYLRLREIRQNGFSTWSEIQLAAPELAIDIQAPIITGQFKHDAVIYEDVDLSLPTFDDADGTVVHQYDDQFKSADMKIANGTPPATVPADEQNIPQSVTSGVPAVSSAPTASAGTAQTLRAADYGFFPSDEQIQFTWDMDHDGSFEAKGDMVTFQPVKPGTQIITLRATDQAGNVAEQDISYHITVPQISLDPVRLQSGIVAGNVEPAAGGMPFVIFRDRDGYKKFIKTPSADAKGKFRTDEFGKFSITDFDFSADAIFVDPKGQELARIDRKTGRVILKSNDLTLWAIGTTINIVNDLTGRVYLIMRYIADGNSDVQLLTGEIDAAHVDALPEGVYVSDRDTTDPLRAGRLPGSAPTFPGGAAIYNGAQVVAAISARGEVSFWDYNYKFRIKGSKSESEPIILELVDLDDKPLFDFYVRTGGDALFLVPSITRALGSKGIIGSIVTPTVKDNFLKILEQLLERARKAGQIADVKSLPVGIFSDPRAESAPSMAANKQPPPDVELFSDVPASHPAFAAIKELQAKKMINGNPDGTFYPDQPISRAEFVKLVLAAAKCQDCMIGDKSPLFAAESADARQKLLQENVFGDIPLSAWYLFCVNHANRLQLVNGYADGTFHPLDPISRAEAAAVLLRAAGIPLKNSAAATYTDLPPDAWYFAAMVTAVDVGLVANYYGSVYPEDKITRGEFAMMASKLLQTNSCDLPTPADPGVVADMCPEVPEDYDGIDDSDGCPEIAYGIADEYFQDPSENFSTFEKSPPGIYVTSNTYEGEEVAHLELSADITANDHISVGIVSEDGKEFFSQSEIFKVPFDFVPPQ